MYGGRWWLGCHRPELLDRCRELWCTRHFVQVESRVDECIDSVVKQIQLPIFDIAPVLLRTSSSFKFSSVGRRKRQSMASAISASSGTPKACLIHCFSTCRFDMCIVGGIIHLLITPTLILFRAKKKPRRVPGILGRQFGWLRVVEGLLEMKRLTDDLLA